MSHRASQPQPPPPASLSQQPAQESAAASVAGGRVGSPTVLRKRPQSVSLARVLVYDGGGGVPRIPQQHHHHHSAAAATSEEEDAFRKLNLGSANPIFGSVSGSHHRHHNVHHRLQHHSSLTIPSTNPSSIISETNLIKVRSSALGKSAPSLSQAMVSLRYTRV